jgi:peptidoglycan/LPS O-acetylase OafA/YrhL
MWTTPSADVQSAAQRFNPRKNSVNALRLGLAFLVLVSHTVQLSTGGADPVGGLTGSDVDVGTMAVDGFFALSGFLIAGSFLASPSVSRYLWRRALRILPGFWVCLVVTAVIIAPLAWLLDYGSLAGYPIFGEHSSTAYVWRNAGLLIREFNISGAFEGGVANGSLHTLFYESACYLMVAVVGVFAVLSRRPVLMLGMLGAAWGITLVEAVAQTGLVAGQPGRELMLRYGTMFVAGTCAHLFASRIRLTAVGGALAALTVVAALVADSLVESDSRSVLIYSLIAPPVVTYLVLLAGSSPRLARVGARRDLSYGLYVYAYPVQATLLVVGAASWWLPAYVAASLAIALALAFISWTYVESPALALKSWTPARRIWHPRKTPARRPALERTDMREGNAIQDVRPHADR